MLVTTGRLFSALLAVSPAILLVLALIISAPVVAAETQQSADVQVIESAELCIADGEMDVMPDGRCAWKKIKLPAAWRTTLGSPLGDAWVKTTFHLEVVPVDGVAVLATTFNRTGKVYVNSIKLRAIGSMEEPLPLNWNRAQYIVLPPSMLQAGQNEIEFQIRTHSWEEGELSILKIGAESTVRPIFERRVFWQNDAVEVIGWVTATIGLVLLGVWTLRRSEASYFWFACVCLAWFASNLDFYVRYAPLSDRAWEKFVFVTTVLRATCIFIFALRYCERKAPKLEAALWIYWATGTAALIFNPLVGEWIGIWFLGPLVTTPFVAFLLVREGMKRNFLDGGLLLVAACTQSALNWYDAWLYQTGEVGPIFLAQYATLLYVVAGSLSLIRHFVASLAGYEKQHAIAVRSLDEATKATQDKNLFFSMVSHELKSPLQSIITVLATEDKRAAGRERRHSLEKIRRAVRYMEAQIRDLFVLSVGDAGRLEMRSETFEVGDLVEEVVSSVEDLAVGKSITLTVKNSGSLFVATDPKRVEQILLNLVENAIKYTQSGSVTISYALEESTTLQFQVADTGIGIAAEHISKLFVPYRRFGLIEREHNSLGIGLAVVQTLVTHLGGTCNVESTPGLGTRFTIRLPVAIEREADLEPVQSDLVRILIVDDRPEMLDDLKEVAETLGYYVDVASSAPEASNLTSIAAYDIVIVDLDMPIKNGFELGSEIRRSDGPNSCTCLVAFSAGNPEDFGKAAADGLWPFDSFEQKPVDARAMKRIVETRPHQKG